MKGGVNNNSKQDIMSSKKDKEKSGYYRFPTPLYEMDVIVVFGNDNIKELTERFKFQTDKAKRDLLDNDGYLGMTSYAFNEKGDRVVLVVFHDRKDCTTKVLCHEAFHAMDYIAAQYGLDYNPDSGNEHLAYLIGHIASNISKALYDNVEDGVFVQFGEKKQ